MIIEILDSRKFLITWFNPGIIEGVVLYNILIYNMIHYYKGGGSVQAGNWILELSG
jgi:hypothetical protein